MKTLKMSLRGVVANLEETPSSQERAFWRVTFGAAETMSVPIATDAKALHDRPIAADLIAELVRFSRVEEAMAATRTY